MSTTFGPGDYVIYRKQKFSVHPSPQAKEIRPCPQGDSYSYLVDKFWVVVDLEGTNKITVCTRRGKRLTINISDPALRRASWLERLVFRSRFPLQSLNIHHQLNKASDNSTLGTISGEALS
jgi:hypothetical protein